MASADQIRSIIIHTLMSPAAQRINFTLGSIAVDPGGLAAVATLIGSGNIGVTFEEDLPRGVKASYDVSVNHIGLRPGFAGASALDRAVLVHECVHALYDAYGNGSFHSRHGSIVTTFSENEAAGYVAEALYYIHEKGAGVTTPDPILKQAYRIANSIRGKAGARVSNEDAMRLRTAISLDPLYAHKGLWALNNSRYGGV